MKPLHLARKSYERGFRAALAYEADLVDGELGARILDEVHIAYLDGFADGYERADLGIDGEVLERQRAGLGRLRRLELAERLHVKARARRRWAREAGFGALLTERRRAEKAQELVSAPDVSSDD
jgi:hypothetical protein